MKACLAAGTVRSEQGFAARPPACRCDSSVAPRWPSQLVASIVGRDMLTWDELMAREMPCRKCRGTFRVRGPIDQAGLSNIRLLLETGQPVSAIRFIREATGGDLRDAKGMYEHVTIHRGTCRQCRAALGEGLLVDCALCGALNIDARAVSGST
jgi:hypothetical protein